MNRIAMLGFLVLPTVALAHHHHFHHHHHVSSSSSHHTTSTSSHNGSSSSSGGTSEGTCVRWALVPAADAGVDAGVVDAGAEENVIAFTPEGEHAYAQPQVEEQVPVAEPVEIARPLDPSLAQADLQDQLDTAEDEASDSAEDGGTSDDVDDQPRMVCVEREPSKGVGCSVLGFAAPTVLLAALWLKPRRRAAAKR